MTFETGARIRNPPCQPRNVWAEEPRRTLRGRGDTHPGITVSSRGELGSCCTPGVLPSTPAFPHA